MRTLTDRVRVRRKDIPWVVVRFLIALALIVFFVGKAREVDFSPLYQVTGIQIVYLVVLKGIVYVATAYRLVVILRAQRMAVSLPWVFAINKIGLLISYVIPSSVLSDVGKIFFFRRFHRESVKMLVAIFLDRLSGLICILFVLGAASALLQMQYPERFARLFLEAKLVRATVMIGLLVGVIVLPVLYWKIGIFKTFIKKHFSFLSFSLGWKIGALSIVGHIVYCFLVVESSRVATTVKLGFLDAAMVFPMSTIATTVPTTPGSIGVGQVVYKYLIDVLTATNTDSGILIFTLLQLVDLPFLILAAVAAMYLAFKKSEAKT